MSSRGDGQALAAAVRAAGLDLSGGGSGRGWTTMGAVLADAVLQRRNRYDAVVLPRARAVEELGLRTTSDVLGAVADESIWPAFSHRSIARRMQLQEMAGALDGAGVQTVDELAQALANAVSEARAALRSVTNVGPKTMSYLPILCGADGVAIDVHLRRFATESGLAARADIQWAALYREAAELLEVEVGTLDRAVWRYMSDAGKRVRGGK